MIVSAQGNALSAGTKVNRAEGAGLCATGLVKSFRARKVVKGVSIEVRAGERRHVTELLDDPARLEQRFDSAGSGHPRSLRCLSWSTDTARMTRMPVIRIW